MTDEERKTLRERFIAQLRPELERVLGDFCDQLVRVMEVTRDSTIQEVVAQLRQGTDGKFTLKEVAQSIEDAAKESFFDISKYTN